MYEQFYFQYLEQRWRGKPLLFNRLAERIEIRNTYHYLYRASVAHRYILFKDPPIDRHLKLVFNDFIYLETLISITF